MVAQTETGDDFVEDQHDAVGGGEFSHLLEVAVVGRQNAHVPGHGFNDHAGDFAFVGFDHFRQGFFVVIRADQRFFHQFFHDALAGGHALGQKAAAAFHQQAVAVAVIAALKFQNLISAGKAAGGADGAHGGFGAGVDHTHHIAAGIGIDDHFRQFHLSRGGKAVGRAAMEGLFDGFQQEIGSMAENQWAVGAYIVDVFFTAHVGDISAFGFGDDNGIAVHIAEGPYRAVHAADHDFAAAFQNVCFIVIQIHGLSLLNEFLKIFGKVGDDHVGAGAFDGHMAFVNHFFSH